MAGDYTRVTHRPARDYSSVLMQQGRVQLDSDWNEQGDILQRRLRMQAMDIFGRCAVPEPTTPDAFKLVALAGPPVDLSIGRGRLYLDGILAEIFDGESWTYASQKYYPDPPPLPTTGQAIAYIDVWEREVTAIEDPDLLEKALGGPDTTTRRQTVWQVKWRAAADAECGTDLDALFPPSAGRLTTSAIAPPASNDPCILSPSGGYRGLENRLYRVEVHTPGGLNTARFKWSHDNGSIVSRVDAMAISGAQTVLTVARIGRDKVLRFGAGDWVEVTDDVRELMGEAGEMAQVVAIDEAALTITLDRTLPTGSGRPFGATASAIVARHTRIRRWDQQAPGNSVDAAGLMTVDGSSVHLEDGVYVQFSLDPAGGELKIGDYWVFAARTADASVEPLTNAPPRGILHHYCQLATLAWQGTPPALDVRDCRHLWPDPHCCTISVRPGESIQHAIDALPPHGGCVCLLPGIHVLGKPILIDARRNIVVEGIGRASKVVTDSAIGGAAAFYIVGGSRQIALCSFLIFSGERLSLVTVAEDASEISLAGMTLVDAATTEESCCVLLAGCSEACVDGSLLVGRVGILQASPEAVGAVGTALRGLRPVQEGDDAGVVIDDVERDQPAAPEAPPLRALRVVDNQFYVREAGVDLRNALDGWVRENIITGLDGERLGPWQRPSPLTVDRDLNAPRAVASPDLHQWLEGNLATLEPISDVEALRDHAVGVRACLLENFDVAGNHIAALRAVAVNFARAVCVRHNRLIVRLDGVLLVFCFDATVSHNRITMGSSLSDKPAEERAEDVAAVLRAKIDADRLAIAVRIARGLEVEANAIEAPSGIGTRLGAVSTSCARPYMHSLLRLLRIGRAWRVAVDLAWLLLVIVRALVAISGRAARVGGAIETKEELEAVLFRGLLTLFGDATIVPAFVGKARIADNRLQVDRFGVYCNEMLSVGGLRIVGNRVSGFTRTGILVAPLFGVGLVDRFARWLHCGLEWLIALLRLLRDRLARMLDGEAVAEPAAPVDLSAGVLATTGVSWLLFFCARFCGPSRPPGGDQPGTQPESPADDLKNALDDLLAHLNPAWLEDLVNQSYVIEGNTLRGTGDGIVTGIDGSRILGNHVTIDLGDTLAFETLMLGRALQRRFAGTPFVDPLLFGALLDVDRDWLLLAALRPHWLEANLTNPGFTVSLRDALQEAGAATAPDSALRPHLRAIDDALNAAAPDVQEASAQWIALLRIIWLGLRGYGIVMVGSDMVCAENRVRALRGCAPLLRPSLVPGTATSGQSALLTVPGVLPAVPSLGGIWQFDGITALLIALQAVGMRGKTAVLAGNRSALRIWAVGLYLVLRSARDRHLTVAGNSVEEALSFGIRTLRVGGDSELDVLDNLVRDAVRYGICHRDFLFPIVRRDEVGLHAKLHRNSVRRTADVFLPPGLWMVDFAALLWLENRTGRTLLGRNHGDGAHLDLERRAVFSASRVAGVSDNHVETDSRIAFQITAFNGLFTSNMTNRINIVPPLLRQPPNVENL